MVSPDQKRVIKAIVGLFETGSTAPDYGAVTILDDGAGVTYGAHQSTDGGESSLDKIVDLYIERGGLYAADLAPYVDRLHADATASASPGNIAEWVDDMMTTLARAGYGDPIMALAQEQVFESHYWEPSAEQAEAMGLVTPLAWLVCYDSTIHSGREGIGRIRRRFPERPPADGGDEREWVLAYLDARRAYLATHSRAAVRATVYRIESMQHVACAEYQGIGGNWDLETPVHIPRPRAEIT